VAACLLWGWALLDADAARRAEGYWREARRAEDRLMQSDWQGSDDEYAHLLALAVRATDCQPRNITYRHWLNVYRWRAISRETDPNTGEVFLAPQSLGFAERIAAEQRGALRLCPVYGPMWCVLGQLERFVLEQRDLGAEHIRIGRRLAPCDPTACFIAGLLHADEGDAEAALGHWERAVGLSSPYYADACSVLVSELERPDLALDLADENARHLIHLESVLVETEAAPDLINEVKSRIVALLEQECQQEGAAPWKLAWIAQWLRHEGKIEEAIAMYRKALASDYGQVWWRYSLAELYAERGRSSDAVRELRVCLRLRPQYTAAAQFLERLLAQMNAGDTAR
jgi:tetratricopeptide (TPR) repeat protein